MFPQAQDVGLAPALYRSLHALDSGVTMAWVKNMIDLYDEHELIDARNVTTLMRPADVRKFFQSRLGKIIPAENVNAERRPAPLRPLPVGDPYDS